MLRRVCLRVYMWRLLKEIIDPLHRRAAMAPFWQKALAPRYWVNTLDANGKPIPIPANRVVPPEYAPRGLPVRRIEIPPPREGRGP